MGYDNPRIKLEMSFLDIIVAMAEGNPDARERARRLRQMARAEAR